MRYFLVACVALGVAVASVACSSGSSVANTAPDAGFPEPIPNGGACGESKACVPYSTDLSIVMSGDRRICPAGYQFDEALVQFPNGELPPAQCSCECGVPAAHAECEYGAVNIGISLADSTCNVPSSIASGLCQTTLKGDAAYAKATALPPKQASCVATVKKVRPPALTNAPFYTCTPTVTQDAACDRGLVCLPTGLPPEAVACVPSLSDVCPAEYLSLLRLTDAVKDDRDCDGCLCETTDSCANPRLELHDPADPNCSKAAQTTVPADGVCHPTGYTTSWLVYKADVVPSPSCKVSAPSVPMGGVFPVAGGASSYFRNYCCR